MEEMCRVADSLRLELTKDWAATRRLLTGPASTRPGFTWPTYDRAPPERAICDKVFLTYYRRDRTREEIRGAREMIKIVVEWLDEE
jgi:hypothetical protein